MEIEIHLNKGDVALLMRALKSDIRHKELALESSLKEDDESSIRIDADELRRKLTNLDKLYNKVSVQERLN